MKHIKSFESFDIDIINEGIKLPELSEEMKQTLDKFIQKNKAWLQKVLAKFNGKSPQEISNMITSPAPVTEGVISDKMKQIGNNVKANLGKYINNMATGAAFGAFGSMLIGLFQLAQTDVVTHFLSGGMIAMLIAIVIYAVGQIFPQT